MPSRVRAPCDYVDHIRAEAGGVLGCGPKRRAAGSRVLVVRSSIGTWREHHCGYCVETRTPRTFTYCCAMKTRSVKPEPVSPETRPKAVFPA